MLNISLSPTKALAVVLNILLTPIKALRYVPLSTNEPKIIFTVHGTVSHMPNSAKSAALISSVSFTQKFKAIAVKRFCNARCGGRYDEY
jgi:hypothetical protein